MPSPSLKIGIVGGGPSGLTLGVLLHKRGIPFTIFERSQRPTDQDLAKPAGSLDLHEETGLAAIRECELFTEFTSLTGDCTESQKLCDKNGNIIYSDEGDQSNRPEISRHKLVKLLLSQLPDSVFRWSHKLLSATKSTVGGRTEVELDFGDNGKHTVDLAVGADGAWSKIRNLLTDVKPRYAGIQNITLNIQQITQKHPHLSDLVGTGTFTCLGDHHGVFSQRSSQDSARIYLFMSTEDEDFRNTSGLAGMTPTEAKNFLLGGKSPFSQWGANIRALVTVACDEESADNSGTKLDIKPLYMLPVGNSWEHQPGVTVIGDASHLMCPWAGEGVNLAMKDALLLSRAVAQALELSSGRDEAFLYTTLSSLVKAFEVEMVAGAKVEAEGTLENGEMMFGSDDGARVMADWFQNMAGRIMPE